MIRESRGDRIFKFFVVVLVVLLALVCLFPFLNILAVSMSSKNMVMAGKVYFWPKELDFAAYNAVFTNVKMWRCSLQLL